jgi:ribosomal protein L32
LGNLALFFLSSFVIVDSVLASDIFIYPAEGQSKEKQKQDKYECHSWAADQTGFDPTRQRTASRAPSTYKEAPEGGLIRGAARGAALGAVAGAITGKPGRGAKVGAATGALFGGMKRQSQRRRERKRQENASAQHTASMDRNRGDYNRAMTVCLEGRGYTVN